MTDKTLIAFTTGIALGGLLGLLFAPVKGSELRSILMKQHGNDNGGIHNFNISELTSRNSVTFAEIKEHLKG